MSSLVDRAYQTARRVLAEVGEQTPGERYLIRTSLELEEQRQHQQLTKGHARTRLRRKCEIAEREHDALWRAALAAAASDDFEFLRGTIGNNLTQQSIWWCESTSEAENVLSEFYGQLFQTRRSSDGIDYGHAGGVSWLDLWRD